MAAKKKTIAVRLDAQTRAAYEHIARVSGQSIDVVASVVLALYMLHRKQGQETAAMKDIELMICMHTHFTGDPPYVGWPGLALALREHFTGKAKPPAKKRAMKKDLRAAVKR